MKKKLALIIISLDECFPANGFSGGGHKVTKNLILGLIESKLFDIDIFCKKGKVSQIQGVNSIKVINKKTFEKDLKEKLKEQNYDYILSSDILLPFANNLVHSNSARHKSKNCKNKFLQLILKIYNAKKIHAQEKNLPRNKAIFTVSESLKKDYVENFNLDEKKVFASHPAVDNHAEFVTSGLNEEFTIGSMAGGGLNKGGYLLLLALRKLPRLCKLKAKIIFPKFHKVFFFKSAVRFLGLQNRIELLPKQENMGEFYKSIDCYVLPSLNEAFGLVVTEAASNFKPSLVSSTTGVRELIKDGENGFVFNREKNPVKNLSQKLVEITDIYFNDNNKFIEIAKNANEMSKKLDWKKFTDTIINNMVGEK
ncbi:MAG: glycosyltransferase family 4 protein [Candidatus Gastranaerophilaceae bacterium]